MTSVNYKEVLGLFATIIAFISYAPYVKDIFVGKTKPHALTWIIWAVVAGVGFSGQIYDHGGPGSWVAGFTALACSFIFIIALFKGEKNIVASDWICLAGASFALVFWFITREPLLSVILAALINALGFVPTLRKSFEKPDEETLLTFVLTGAKFVLALFSLSNITATTTLYLASGAIMNCLLVTVSVVRRKQLVKI